MVSAYGGTGGSQPVKKSNRMDNVQDLTEDQKRRLSEIEAENGKPEPEREKEPDKPKPSEEEPANGEESEEGEEEDGEEPEEEPKPSEERKPKFVRLEKHLKERQKNKELTDTVTKLQEDLRKVTEKGGKVTADLADDIKKFAEEANLDPDVLGKIVAAAEKGATSKLEQRLGAEFKKLEEANAHIAEEKEVETQEAIWRKGFDKLSEQFPEEKEHLQSIKGRLKKLAFSTDYHKTPLDVIYRGVEGLRPDKRKTLENGRGGGAKDDTVVDFAKIIDENDEDAINAMDTKTFNDFRKFAKTYNK